MLVDCPVFIDWYNGTLEVPRALRRPDQVDPTLTGVAEVFVGHLGSQRSHRPSQGADQQGSRVGRTRGDQPGSVGRADLLSGAKHKPPARRDLLRKGRAALRWGENGTYR